MSQREQCRVGSKFFNLTVIGPAFRVHAGKSQWKKARLYCVCECVCGSVCASAISDLLSEKMKSCGCWRVHIGKLLGESRAAVGHGGSKTRLYHLWRGMQLRCYVPSNPSYADYGGRGITVCDEWRESFEAYRDWALANGFANGLQIDRIDNNSGYGPSNCRWVTCQVNNNNRRSSRIVSHGGTTQSLKDWSRDSSCRVTYWTLWRRIKDGWPFEKAMATPELPRGRARTSFRVEAIA